MPFKSERQRRFMWAKHPDIAKKWAHGQHSTSSQRGSGRSSSTGKRSKRR